jgi:hypothetical protein
MFAEFVFFVACFGIILICCTKARERDNAESDEAANADLQTVRQTMSQRRLAQPSAPTQEEVDEARQERERLVKDSLFHRKLEEGDSVSSIQNIIGAAQDRYEENKDGNTFVRSWRSVASSTRTLSKTECSICLDTYKTGETICWAKTDECDHIFHQECIQEWMKDHNDCPLCRTNLVSIQESA